MPNLSLARAGRPRSRSLVAILLLTVALAGFLAYEAWDAARSHRVTAERTIRDYANLAAWEFAASTKEQIYSTLAWVFSPLSRVGAPAPHAPLPEPEVLANAATRKLQCSGDSTRYYFRLDLRSDALTTSGDTPAGAMRAWIRDTVAVNARKVYGKDWSYAAIFGTVADQPRGIVYQVMRDRRGRPVAAYGFELCMAEFGRPNFEKVMKHFSILPPTLTGKLPNDSLFSVRVSDLDGNLLYRSAASYPETFGGEYRLDAFGGLRTQVYIRPEMATALVIGGLPSSRLPIVLGVLALTILLVGVGLLQLRREEELARLRSDFVASVSHELRTPLAQVRMFAETLLLGRVRSDDERRRSLEIVDQEARRLTHLVENILQFSRAERRAIHLKCGPTDVAGGVRDAVEVFAPVARARQVTVRVEVEQPLRAHADEDALRQILLNLLDNAVKYGPVRQTVTVGAARDGSRVRIWVDDEGPGVGPADRRRIWEPFHRLQRDLDSAVAGSGIGLSVVAELVLLQGGRAWVEDAPHRGARFVVELEPARDDGPLVRAGSEQPSTAALDRVPAGSSTHGDDR